MTELTLEAAERFAKAAVAEARAKSLNALAIAVIDVSGNLKFALREDGSGIAGVDIALGKARAALTFGCSSRQITDALAGNPFSASTVVAGLQGRVILMAGAVLIHDGAGSVIGAIGAAGDSPDNDEAVVIAATNR
jgi:uncharacterized protein GlcG (DUF336 family)